MSAHTGIATTTDDAARRSLGAFLRLMRDRAAPGRSAMSARRRVRGLRREEVSSAAGISVTWYTWLEQGRQVRVSRRTVQAIGRALGLSTAERAHLLQLADAAMHPERTAMITAEARAPLRRLVDALDPHPAYAVNGLWDVLWHNGSATRVFGDFARGPGRTPNVLHRLLVDADWRERFEDWPAIVASAVAQFRAATGRFVAEPLWRARVSSLRDASPLFAELWDAHRLAPSESYIKVVLHPSVGRLPLLYASMHPSDCAADVQVVVYMPQDEATRARLQQLGANGGSDAGAISPQRRA